MLNLKRFFHKYEVSKINTILFVFLKKEYHNLRRFFLNKNVKLEKNVFEKLKNIEIIYPKVMSTTETLERVINEKLSVARFGDGEFEFCFRKTLNHPYQSYDPELSKMLLKVLQSRNERVLICIPPFSTKYNNIKNWYGKLDYWQWYWLNNFDIVSKGLFKDRIYGNAFISRNDVFYENSIDFIKKIWEKRKVVFIIGAGGRFDVNSDLFNNILEYNIIYAPSVQAFKEFDRIILECRIFSKDHLFLLAVGPTATVLAYELGTLGHQAIDIGHLPTCLKQYRGLIVSPEALPFTQDNNVKF